MALVHLNFNSKYLSGSTDVNIILPDCARTAEPQAFYGSGKQFPVLWLLHGTFGDYSDWLRKTNVELYAEEKNLIVVMPSAHNTDYANWPGFGTGYQVFDYLTEELMPLIYGWFPASDKREDNYIAGLSMGGRGTCVYAFNHPEKFAGAAILSANPSDFNKMKTSGSPMWERMKKSAINFEGGEEEFLNSYQNTVKVLREKVASGVKLPKIFIGAGEEDQMIMKDFPATKELFKELGIDAEYYTVPGLRHEWRYWDMAIEKALDYFGIEKIAE